MLTSSWWIWVIINEKWTVLNCLKWKWMFNTKMLLQICNTCNFALWTISRERHFLRPWTIYYLHNASLKYVALTMWNHAMTLVHDEAPQQQIVLSCAILPNYLKLRFQHSLTLKVHNLFLIEQTKHEYSL